MMRHFQLEGLFTYIAPEASGASAQSTARVFLSISKCLESSDEPSTPRSPLIRKRPSQFSLRSNTPINRPRTPSDPPPCTPGRRVYDFSITLPDSSKSGEELPHSFSHSQQMPAGGRGRTGTERAEVSYRLIVNWEAAYDPARPTRHSPRLARISPHLLHLLMFIASVSRPQFSSNSTANGHRSTAVRPRRTRAHGSRSRSGQIGHFRSHAL
jgi:hypothetical protein